MYTVFMSLVGFSSSLEVTSNIISVENLVIRNVFFHVAYISLQVKGNSNFNTRNLDSKRSYEDLSRSTYESSLSSLTYDDYLGACPDNLPGSEVRPTVENDSDGSDSEIFRVKRRSSLKVDKRNINDVVSSKHSDNQVCFVFFLQLLNPCLFL